jgi:hypothetical protein
MQKIKGRGSRKRRGEDGERSPQFPALARLENAAPTGRAHSPSSPRAPWRGRPPSPVPWVRPGCYTSVLHRDTARVPLPPRLPHGQPGSAVERDSAAAAAGDGHARPRRRAAGGLARRGDTPVPLLPPRLSTCCSGFFPSICCRAPRRRSPGGAEGSPTARPRSHRSASAALAPSVRHQSRSLSRWGAGLSREPTALPAGKFGGFSSSPAPATPARQPSTPMLGCAPAAAADSPAQAEVPQRHRPSTHAGQRQPLQIRRPTTASRALQPPRLLALCHLGIQGFCRRPRLVDPREYPCCLHLCRVQSACAFRRARSALREGLTMEFSVLAHFFFLHSVFLPSSSNMCASVLINCAPLLLFC